MPVAGQESLEQSREGCGWERTMCAEEATKVWNTRELGMWLWPVERGLGMGTFTNLGPGLLGLPIPIPNYLKYGNME
jgi:hypothetical protein